MGMGRWFEFASLGNQTFPFSRLFYPLFVVIRRVPLAKHVRHLTPRGFTCYAFRKRPRNPGAVYSL